MVVYKPKNKTSSSIENQNNIIADNCDCNHHIASHHDNHCPCPCPQDAVITIEVDGSPEIIPDVVYGPKGKDGLINGYNEVEIIGGNNIDIETKGGCCCNKNKIIINSTTSVHEIDAEPDSDESCDCGCECCFEQAKPRSQWIIHHNLNKYPSVTVVEQESKREIICEVKYIDMNEIHLFFNGKFRGYAYLN